MPKVSGNDTKMDAEISDVAYFFNKGENARKYCIYNIKLGFGHLQNDEKSIKKRCEIDAGKSNAKRRSNDPEMKPNGEPKSIPNRKSDEKKACEKRCRNQGEGQPTAQTDQIYLGDHPPYSRYHISPVRGPGGAYRQESHSLLTPVGSADFCQRDAD